MMEPSASAFSMAFTRLEEAVKSHQKPPSARDMIMPLSAIRQSYARCMFKLCISYISSDDVAPRHDPG